MNNYELETSIIVTRRNPKANEFIFKSTDNIQYAARLFEYIESISNIKIENITKEELPIHQGMFGWRIIKDGK